MLCGSVEDKEIHPVKGMKCINDFANLTEGYWWKWKAEKSKSLYKSFTENIRNSTYLFNESSVKYSGNMPRPYECPRKKSCLGGLDSKCEEGYDGPLCAVCAQTYYKSLDGCSKCPSDEMVIVRLVALVAVVIFVMALVVWTSKKKSEMDDERPLVDLILARLKIVVGFYQVTYGLLNAFDYIEWPSVLSCISQYTDFIQLNVLQFAPIHCVFPSLKMDTFDNMKAMMGVNMGVIVISFVVYMLWKTHITKKEPGSRRQGQSPVTCKRSRLPNCLLHALLYLPEYLFQNRPYAFPGLSDTVCGPQERNMSAIPKSRL